MRLLPLALALLVVSSTGAQPFVPTDGAAESEAAEPGELGAPLVAPDVPEAAAGDALVSDSGPGIAREDAPPPIDPAPRSETGGPAPEAPLASAVAPRVGLVVRRVDVRWRHGADDPGPPEAPALDESLRPANGVHPGAYGVEADAVPLDLWRPRLPDETAAGADRPVAIVLEGVGIRTDRHDDEGYSPSWEDVLRPAMWLGTRMAIVGFACGVVYSVGGLISDALTTGLNEGTVLAFGALIGMPVVFAVAGFAAGAVGGGAVVVARVVIGE